MLVPKAFFVQMEESFARIHIPAMCYEPPILGFTNMWLAVFADVGVMILAVLNAIQTLFGTDSGAGA